MKELINMQDQYETLDGDKVRILCTDNPNCDYPIVGIIEGVSLPQVWTRTGDYYYNGFGSDHSLRKVDPYKPFKDALAEGKTVEVLDCNNKWKNNAPYCWTEPPENYRIKPEPTYEEIKFLAYLTKYGAVWYVKEGSDAHNDCEEIGNHSRIPELDKAVKTEVK